MLLFPFAPAAVAALSLAYLGGPSPQPGSSFHLSERAYGGQVSEASLTCDPAGGSHLDSAKACAVIQGANGDFQRLPTRHQLCSALYAPVDVVVAGFWRGTPVSFQATYANKCSANAESSGVFGF
ncbi:MAG: protease inhibitor protein [Amycolatopsis sp.]|jgi:hypothetical protein|uniref:SSI family serine proteinase inhibitor n=1 Tax=Amycolatopsis sp. TaxID=37632 RepID=UPI0026093DB7|nr:SSI family serine proteinase inhibitor [Amycolatopsis sp.]MCU1684341.1 protease inhibitor protein [Amycolatopsis sp.]